MDKLLSEIKKNNATCVFVSPHFDDALFSAGGLMYKIAKQKNTVILVNLFTKASKTKTISARAYLSQTGYKSQLKLYKDRQSEDLEAAKLIGIKTINLGFVDALWRTKKTKGVTSLFSKVLAEFAVIYPTYRWHISSGRISSLDRDMIAKISKHLLEAAPKNKKTIFFAPVGIGRHVDHLISKEVVASLDRPAYFWADYPYVTKDTVNIKYKKQITFLPDWKMKEKLIRTYATQFDAIFGDKKIKHMAEKFFIL